MRLDSVAESPKDILDNIEETEHSLESNVGWHPSSDLVVKGSL